MDRASDAPVVASAGTQAEPRTPASWLLSAGRFQTAAPLPVGSDPRSVPRTEPVHIAPLPSSPALGRYAKGLPAAVILLRRNRTDRPLNEGFLLRRLHHVVNNTVRLIAVVPAYGRDAAVFDPAPHLHLAGNHVVFTGSEMFVSGNTGPFRAIQEHCPMACLLGRTKELKADPRIELKPWLLRGVNVGVREPLVVERVALRLIAGHLYPPGFGKGAKGIRE